MTPDRPVAQMTFPVVAALREARVVHLPKKSGGLQRHKKRRGYSLCCAAEATVQHKPPLGINMAKRMDSTIYNCGREEAEVVGRLPPRSG